MVVASPLKRAKPSKMTRATGVLPEIWPLTPAATKKLENEAYKEARDILRYHLKNKKPVYIPHGSAATLLTSTAPEVLISGSAGTGKSRACLQKVDQLAEQYPGMRALLVRKTRASLSESALMTYERDVMGYEHPVVAEGAQRAFRQKYRYPNGSEVVLGGMDKSTRIMSTEFDIIFVQEAIELTEEDWEMLSTRLRNGVVPYQQLVGDTNPSAPTHWLKQRADKGQLELIESRHEDNPTLWKGGAWTELGKVYLSKLDNLTGARKLRLRYGKWVKAEGVIYEAYSPSVHLIDKFEVPPEWRRIRVVDFGYTNPFVCQWWAIDPDGRMYRYCEIYMSQRTVKVHAALINELSEGESIEATICDHDAEDRQTLAENGISNIAAIKPVSVGIEKVQERLKLAADGKPRIFFMRDSLVEVDGSLVDAKRPFATEQEFDGYAWANKKDKEVPIKVDDHGVDATRYGAMYLDGGQQAQVYVMGQGYVKA